jgi:hypothetical protein
MDLAKLNIQPDDPDHVLRERCLIYACYLYKDYHVDYAVVADVIYKYIKCGDTSTPDKGIR